jgi:hypothetical protein
MSVANCKTICREIEEADHGQNLTASVMEHLRGCGRCETFYDERLKLRQLVASLETVAAPADFGLRVRSRIAGERVGARPGFWLNNFTFGIPAVALAGLVLAVGLVFALKVWKAPTAKTFSVQSPKASEPSPEVMKNPPTESPSVTGDRESTARNDHTRAIEGVRRPNKRNLSRSVVASLKGGGRLTSKEFGTTPATVIKTVIKKEETVASVESFPIFSIETSSQPLRLSLDYSGGVSRTISVPALSFGSETVLTGDNSPLVRNSTRGAW